MTIDQKQPPATTINKRFKTITDTYHSSKVGKPAIGFFKFVSVGMVLMFFRTKEQGLTILKEAVRHGIASADDATELDLMIMRSNFPLKESGAERYFEFSSRDVGRGPVLLLKVDDQIMAVASRLDTAQKMFEQITRWVESYSIPNAKVEEVMMNFHTTNQIPPPESNSNSLPYVVDTDE